MQDILLSLIPCIASITGCQWQRNISPPHNQPVISAPKEHITPQKPEKPAPPKSTKCIHHPKVHTFMYHYIRDHQNEDSLGLKMLSIPPHLFEEHMKAISHLKQANTITTMTWEEFVQAMESGCFPHKNIWIFTADDGWSDNFYTLAPIAEKYQIPFIFGIVSGKLNEHNFVTESEVRILSDNPLFTIASHSINHTPLNYGSLQNAKNEICESKKHLEKIIEKPVNIFIYPYGKIGRNSIRFLKECGYKIAWSTDFGKFLNWKHPNFFNMNRINVTPNISAQYFFEIAEKDEKK